MGDFIGVAGIISTLLVGVLTCIVTWAAAKRSQKTMKISWNADVSEVLHIGSELHIGEIQIIHDGIEMENPYMIQMNIKNTGNTAIDSPSIKIKIENSKKVIPAGFGKIPYGYEDKWRLSSINDKECVANLDHINPKQELSIILFAEGKEPQIFVSCPMKDVFVKERDKLKDTSITYISEIVTILLSILSLSLSAQFIISTIF